MIDKPMFLDKIIKEDENFVYFETKYGIGYVASKKFFWHESFFFQEKDPHILNPTDLHLSE